MGINIFHSIINDGLLNSHICNVFTKIIIKCLQFLRKKINFKRDWDYNNIWLRNDYSNDSICKCTDKYNVTL